MEYYFTTVLFISHKMADCTNEDVSAPMRGGGDPLDQFRQVCCERVGCCVCALQMAVL